MHRRFQNTIRGNAICNNMSEWLCFFNLIIKKHCYLLNPCYSCNCYREKSYAFSQSLKNAYYCKITISLKLENLKVLKCYWI